jgi:membrane fusion protein (multidrug efflux system)
MLMPGMFARAVLTQAVKTNAITVPQRTVTRSAAGSATVLVVGQDDKVQPRQVQLGTIVGQNIVVTDGLQVGERIIVEGLQKARPGSVVKPVPFRTASATPVQQVKDN